MGVSISAFASLAGVPVSITISAVGLKNFTLTTETKKCKWIIKKKKKKHDNIVLLATTKRDSIEVSISKALID